MQPLTGEKDFYAWKIRITCSLYAKGFRWDLVENDIGEPSRKQTALNIMKESVDYSLLMYIQKCTSPREVITKFQNLFYSNIPLKHALIRSKIEDLKFSGIGNMNEFQLKLLNIFHDLRLAGANIDDCEIIATLLCKLPDDYLVVKLECNTEKWPTLNELRRKLLVKDQMLVFLRERTTDSQEDHKTNRDDYLVRCFKCGELGHKRSQCDSLKYTDKQ